jgi:ankyrin repeat protein
VDALDDDGSTPLHLAISELEPRAAELLLEHGTNVGLQNNKCQTALHLASQRGQLNIMRLLLVKGANVDALDSDGSTPLHLVISKTYTFSEAPESSEASHDSKVFVDSNSLGEVIKLLLEYGASVHWENNRGETPFQAAGVRGLQEITGSLSMHIQSERTA